MEQVRQFVEQMLRDKGMPPMDEEVYKQLVDDLQNRLIDFINRRVIGSMSEQDAAGLEHVLDEQPIDPAKVQGYIDAHVPDKQQITLNAMMEFRSQYLGQA